MPGERELRPVGRQLRGWGALDPGVEEGVPAPAATPFWNHKPGRNNRTKVLTCYLASIFNTLHRQAL